MVGRRLNAHRSATEVAVKGTRMFAALAAALPIFYFSSWVELTTVDQPTHVQRGAAFTASVEGVIHLGGPSYLQSEPEPSEADPVPPIDLPPDPQGTVDLRLGILVPVGWKAEGIDYAVTDVFPALPDAPQFPGLEGTLTPTPDETWVYETYHPAPSGYEWHAFGGVQVDATWEAQVRFAVRIAAGDRDGRYRLVYGTWSQQPYWYVDDPPPPGGGDTSPPDPSLLPVPPPSFVETVIAVGDVGPAPRVTSFEPAEGAADVPVGTDLRVTFDRDMDLASLREGGIQVYAGPVYYPLDGYPRGTEVPTWRPDTPLDPQFKIPPWEPWPIPVQIFWNAATRTAVVDPLDDLAGHTVHTILVGWPAQAVDGAPVDEYRSASFLTERTSQPPFFADVPPDHRFRQAIQVLYGAGVLTGFPDGRFRPDDAVTRGQLATMLVRLLGLHTPQPDAPPPFRDLPAPADDVGADYVAEAFQAGIAAGFDDGTFRPHDPVTRIQMTRMIVRAAQVYMASPPPDYSAGFADVDQVDQGFVNWAAYNDLAEGKAPGRFDPWTTATRGHAARLLYGVWNLLPRPFPGPEPDPGRYGSGIEGLVTLGPLSPVERPGEVNERPYEATVVIRALEPGGPPEGREVRRVTSGTDGRFEVSLPPGVYILDPLPRGNPWPIAPGMTVTVESRAFVEVHIAYDTGIR